MFALFAGRSSCVALVVDNDRFLCFLEARETVDIYARDLQQLTEESRSSSCVANYLKGGKCARDLVGRCIPYYLGAKEAYVGRKDTAAS